MTAVTSRVKAIRMIGHYFPKAGIHESRLHNFWEFIEKLQPNESAIVPQK